MHLYFTDRDNPITKDASNWEMDDEIYYDMDILPEVRILAAAYTPKPLARATPTSRGAPTSSPAAARGCSIYDIQPQMWTYERTADGGRAPYRAFVSIPGHLYENFNRPNYRAILLRGIAWAGKRANVDELCKTDELGDALRYPEGGRPRPPRLRAKIEVHPEFDLTLVAAEPLITKAMNIDWDERAACGSPKRPSIPTAARRAEHAAPWKDTRLAPASRVRTAIRRTRSRILVGHQRRRRDGSQARLRRQARARHRLRLLQGRRHRHARRRTSGISRTRTATRSPTSARSSTPASARSTRTRSSTICAGDSTAGSTPRTATASATVTSPRRHEELRPRSAAASCASSRTAARSSSISSRGGNTWGLDITWDGQVFWTQPTSGTVFFHTVLPEYVLAKGQGPGDHLAGRA